MKKLLVTNIETLKSSITNIEKAAQLVKLSVEEIEFSLEEFGICETDIHTITDIILI